MHLDNRVLSKNNTLKRSNNAEISLLALTNSEKTKSIGRQERLERQLH